MFKLALKPQWIALLLFALALATGFMFLSKWQLNSSTLGQVYAAPAKDVVRPYSEVMLEHSPLTSDLADSKVAVTGSYVEGSSYLIENKQKDGQDGYWIVSEFVPDSAPLVSTGFGQDRRAIAVARAWTSVAEIPDEPEGTVTLVGRVVANDAPSYSKDVSDELAGHGKVLASAAAAQLMNLWDAPLYTSLIAVDAESKQGESALLEADGTVKANSTILGQSDVLLPVQAEQYEDQEVNLLNIFYALEWVVFAFFAIFMWWRMLKDEYEKQLNPAEFFEYEGEYWFDEDAGRYYYWDPADQKYYYFDEVEQS